ncbi:MAG: hypothetical protein LBJ67_15380 [Planctomycetaceae bacterium]|nr:hypothetical protein [Planctomycetaceae bacterium]
MIPTPDGLPENCKPAVRVGGGCFFRSVEKNAANGYKTFNFHPTLTFLKGETYDENKEKHVTETELETSTRFYVD